MFAALVELQGIKVAPVPWQGAYLLAIIIACIPLALPLSLGWFRSSGEMPVWLALPALLAMLLLHPCGLVFLLFINTRVLAAGAPFGAFIVSFGFTLFCLYLTAAGVARSRIRRGSN